MIKTILLRKRLRLKLYGEDYMIKIEIEIGM